ncbi:MAG TPA: hypothetical protein VGX28_00845 [Frankiaceae bacterium]|jgi:hypothetical protein|nr:hypothetical protein [Frankiaceae bacterium]
MRLVPALAAAALALAACGASGDPRPAATPTASPTARPLATVVGREPTDAEVREASAAYLAATRSEVVSITVEDGHVGVYVRGVPEWSLDAFVEHLPVAAEAARDMLALWPEVDDVDICGDGPWLPHEEYTDFATASRVQLFRDRMGRVPARFETAAQVIREGGTTRSIDYYLDGRIIRESRAYRDAARTSSRKTIPPG